MSAQGVDERMIHHRSPNLAGWQFFCWCSVAVSLYSFRSPVSGVSFVTAHIAFTSISEITHLNQEVTLKKKSSEYIFSKVEPLCTFFSFCYLLLLLLFLLLLLLNFFFFFFFFFFFTLKKKKNWIRLCYKHTYVGHWRTSGIGTVNIS